MKITLQEALARLPATPTAQYPEGAPSVTVFSHGSMLLKVFTPSTNRDGIDRQLPHDQDELYLVHRGSATMVIGAQSFPATPGDAFFVPAGVRHRFDAVSHDFATWVVFYGPQGGETT